MSCAAFIRVHDAEPERRSEALRDRIERHRCGAETGEVFCIEMREFASIPGSPFAYWAGNGIRRIFREFPPLEGNAGTVRVGLQTSDDSRFVRAWWEVDPRRIGFSPEDTRNGRGWVHFAKGGSYSPYYADVHLVVNWFGRGAEIKNFYKPDGRLASRPQNEEFYFRPGLTWPRRTTSGLSVRRLPAGCAFADKGPSAFVAGDDTQRLTVLQALLQSSLAETLIATTLAAVAAAARSYEVGVIQQLPVPHLANAAGLTEPCDFIFEYIRISDRWNETSHAFGLPSLIRDGAPEFGLAQTVAVEEANGAGVSAWAADAQTSLDRQVCALYGLEESDAAPARPDDHPDPIDVPAADATNADEDDAGGEAGEEAIGEDASRRVANLLMWCVGVAFGRWDVRMARDPSLIPALQGPFERLPPVAPGGLVGPDGLPATPDRIASEAWLRARPNVITLPEPGSFEGPESVTARDYPIEVAWDGILVDDPGHPRDIVAKVREVLAYVYGSAERAQEIEEEALGILQEGGRTPRTLRDWFRNQKAAELGKTFFDFHIQRYRKSRRKAPIYWRLTSNPGRGQAEYSVWLYYHRLTGDTLWQVLTRYVGPKRELEARRLEELRRGRERAGAGERGRIEKEIEAKLQLLEELDWFEARLRAVAGRGYAPELDDGVIINLAPLHELVPWSEPEKVWKKLEDGECDWAKLAMKYWPERVRERCREDKSLAIAHGLAASERSATRE
ncbi:MAG: hypothetical protein IRZ00_01020 [Gemmatimonadetes bacterium]|nr:hypothetical protein [Gemmatimonadota bacterium]